MNLAFSKFSVFFIKKKKKEPNVFSLFSLFSLFLRIENNFQKQKPNRPLISLETGDYPQKNTLFIFSFKVQKQKFIADYEKIRQEELQGFFSLNRIRTCKDWWTSAERNIQ